MAEQNEVEPVNITDTEYKEEEEPEEEYHGTTGYHLYQEPLMECCLCSSSTPRGMVRIENREWPPAEQEVMVTV